jgi:hypothetical protein
MFVKRFESQSSESKMTDRSNKPTNKTNRITKQSYFSKKRHLEKHKQLKIQKKY